MSFDNWKCKKCGHEIKITLNMPLEKCPECGAEYGVMYWLTVEYARQWYERINKPYS